LSDYAYIVASPRVHTGTSRRGFCPSTGQQLWQKDLMSYQQFPPLQAPETYNLGGILAEVKKGKGHPGE